MTETLPPAIQALSKPGILPGSAGQATIIQTQMSWVLLTVDFAFKFKKPVDLGYVDYTSLEKRLYFCQKEVELNRRLCPDSYLGVVPVTLKGGEYLLGGTGEIADYTVQMKRLPQERMLDWLLLNGEVTPDMLNSVAVKVAGFHRKAETGKHIDVYGSMEAVRFNVAENFEQTTKYTGPVALPRSMARIKRFTHAFLDSHAGLFAGRVTAGHIRDCHGDLHSSHICFTDRLCIYDCIEFNDRFRYSDTASEVAFLAMDLDHYGRADISTTFIQDYIEASADTGIESLLRFYKCYRAMVRAKVNCFKLDDPYVSDSEKASSGSAARLYFDLAESYTLEKPVLLATAGLTGSGKSTLARALGRRMGMVVISSDVIRKGLAGIPSTRHCYDELDSGIYSPEFSHLTYETMFKQAEHWLSRGVSVILDATFTQARSRQAAAGLALRQGADFGIMEFCIKDDQALARLEERMNQPGNVSDGRAEVYFKLKQEYQPLTGTETAWRVIINCSIPLEENINRVQNYIYRE
ncbi:MAG: AAA family ATPase [Dehalococcoidaceae bacterium]|nr:AAA family ATPase [Dehalococcoidaceae bacterium]